MGIENEGKKPEGQEAENFQFPEENTENKDKEYPEKKAGDDGGLHKAETEPKEEPLYPVEYEILERALALKERNPGMSATSALMDWSPKNDPEFFDRLPDLLRKLPEGHYLRRAFAELDDKKGEPIYPAEYEILERALALKEQSYVEGSFVAPLEHWSPKNDPEFFDRLPDLVRKLPEGHHLRRFFQGYLNEKDMRRRGIKPFVTP